VELVAQSVLTAESDFVSLHLPAMPSTVGMVNAAFLAGMKPGSHLINTARGELIDEAALADALLSGRLGGAALDTFASEPLPASSPLLSAPNLILTPHCGAHTDSAASRMGWGALNDCLAVLRGLQPAYPVVR
jgi:phosphoglycerate dehydrogenase-like enzyme